MEGQKFWRDRTVGGTELVEGQTFWRDRTFGGTEHVEGQTYWKDRTEDTQQKNAVSEINKIVVQMLLLIAIYHQTNHVCGW